MKTELDNTAVFPKVFHKKNRIYDGYAKSGRVFW